MHAMSKSTFTVKTDGETGLKYVTKTEDKLPKNHRETYKELISGVMPASPGKAKQKKMCVYCHQLKTIRVGRLEISLIVILFDLP